MKILYLDREIIVCVKPVGIDSEKAVPDALQAQLGGEVFTLPAGNCLSLDEPLVLTGLEPGTYCIEEIFACPNAYISTYTGPVCGRCVNITGSRFPTVITICCRKRLCRLCHGYGCGCSACGACR